MGKGSVSGRRERKAEGEVVLESESEEMEGERKEKRVEQCSSSSCESAGGGHFRDREERE